MIEQCEASNDSLHQTPRFIGRFEVESASPATPASGGNASTICRVDTSTTSCRHPGHQPPGVSTSRQVPATGHQRPSTGTGTGTDENYSTNSPDSCSIDVKTSAAPADSSVSGV